MHIPAVPCPQYPPRSSTHHFTLVPTVPQYHYFRLNTSVTRTTMSSVPTIWHHASSTYFNKLGCCLVSALERQSQDSPTTARAMGGDFLFTNRSGQHCDQATVLGRPDPDLPQVTLEDFMEEAET